ncbi:hypothetical protein GCM10028862_16370 [Luteimonas pelagia]
MRSSKGSGTRPARSEPGTSTFACRPSRGFALALALLGLLAAASLHASDLPSWFAMAASPLAIGWGLLAAARSMRAPPDRITPDRVPRSGDGDPIDRLRIAWRGPLAFAAWRDPRGRRQCRAWWPDVLSPGRRRELRLACGGDEPTTRPRSMAG